MLKIKFDYSRQTDIEAFYTAATRFLISDRLIAEGLTLTELTEITKINVSQISKLLLGTHIRDCPRRKNEHLKLSTTVQYIRTLVPQSSIKTMIDGVEFDILDREQLALKARDAVARLVSGGYRIDLARSLAKHSGTVDSWRARLVSISDVNHPQRLRNHPFIFLLLIQLDGSEVWFESDFKNIPEPMMNPIRDIVIP